MPDPHRCGLGRRCWAGPLGRKSLQTWRPCPKNFTIEISMKNVHKGNSKEQGLAVFIPWRERRGQAARLWLLIAYDTCILRKKKMLGQPLCQSCGSTESLKPLAASGPGCLSQDCECRRSVY